MRTAWSIVALAVIAAATAAAQAPPVPPPSQADKWVVAVGRSAIAGEAGLKEATGMALRKAVESACGVFLTGQSRVRNYKAVYDRVLVNSVGYIREHTVTKTTTTGGIAVIEIRALVSTQRFEEDWASVAHALEQENNPRMMVAILEYIQQRDAFAQAENTEVKENGIVQGKIEDYLLSRGVQLVDQGVSGAVTKRDVLLAAAKDEPAEVAALGVRFHADVVVIGRATVKFSNALEVAGQTMYQYVASLSIKVIQADSARVLASKSFGPKTVSSMQRVGGEDKALSQLGQTYAPELLSAVVEAWRNRANSGRTLVLSIVGMDYELFKVFKEQASKIEGMHNIRMREIVEGMAQIDIESDLDNESLADRLGKMMLPRLSVTEITANRLKLKVLTDAPAP